MKSASNIRRSLHVLLLALCGLSFYAVLLILLFLIVGLAVSTNVHARAPAKIAAFTAVTDLSTITPSNSLFVNIRVTSLPRQITLCRDFGYEAVIEMLVGSTAGEYEWDVYIDADGNPATGNHGSDAALWIYTIDPKDRSYYSHGCAPHTVDTAKSLVADLVDVLPDADGQYWYKRTRVPLEVDFANNTIKVVLDRNSPGLANLSPSGTFGFSADGIYQGYCSEWECQSVAYAGDSAGPLLLSANRSASASDPGDDVYGCDPTVPHPDTTWCQLLDIVDVSVAVQGAALSAVNIDASFSGSWFDPAQSGHGLMLEVLSDHRLLAMWFAFNPEGSEQSWFGGVGAYSGATATITDVALPTGGRWIPYFDPNSIVRSPWGTLIFTFTDCDHGRVDFSSGLGYGSGSMNLLRLTHPAGLTCP